MKESNISLFDKYKNDIFIIVCITYFINIKFGIIATILYVLIFLLSNHKDNQTIINKKQLYNNLSYDNPYNNYLIGSLNIGIDRFENEIEKNKLNEINLYENAENKTIGSINKGLRDFYTMPVITYPNDTKAFANFLLSKRLSCKENNNCIIYDDIRYHTR